MITPVYFETRFRFNESMPTLPVEFVIVSAHATTGEVWTPERNQAAECALEAELRARSGWRVRIVGYSPATDHAEPSWAVEMPLDEACDLGKRYYQDAIYHIRDDVLSVTFCDEHRALVHVGSFRRRLDRPSVQ